MEAAPGYPFDLSYLLPQAVPAMPVAQYARPVPPPPPPPLPGAPPSSYSFAMQSLLALESENARLRAENKTQLASLVTENARLKAEAEQREHALTAENAELKKDNGQLQQRLAKVPKERKLRPKTDDLPGVLHKYLQPLVAGKSLQRYVFESSWEAGEFGRRKKDSAITEATSRPIERHRPLDLLKDEAKRLDFKNVQQIGVRSLRKAFCKAVYEQCGKNGAKAATLMGYRDVPSFLRFLNLETSEEKKGGKYTKRDLTTEEIRKLTEEGWPDSPHRDRNRALCVALSVMGSHVTQVVSWKVGDVVDEAGAFRKQVTTYYAGRRKRKQPAPKQKPEKEPEPPAKKAKADQSDSDA